MSRTPPPLESSEAPPSESADETRQVTLPPGYDASTVRTVSSPDGSPAPTRRARPSLPTRLWRTVKSIYYASTPAWQFLKSGALLMLGLFCWSAANLLLSYEPSWHWPYFFMAYGVLLIPYGPFTHLVLVPHLLPWLRRRTRGSWLHALGRHLTLTSLTLFFIAVVGLGLFPPSFMQIDFRAAASGTTPDVNPTLTCSPPEANEEAVLACHLDQTTGVGAITVQSGGTQILRREKPPFSFSLRRDQLVEVVGQSQFQVIVHDDANTPVRRFNRTLSMTR